MFNRTTINHESKVVAVTKEIEKTISPDKVTEMYDKVHEEVEKTILRKVAIEENDMHGVVMEVQNRYDTRSRNIHLFFVLNGKEYHSTEEVKDELTDYNLYEKFYDFYLRTISGLVMKQTVNVLVPQNLLPANHN